MRSTAAICTYKYKSKYSRKVPIDKIPHACFGSLFKLVCAFS
ncbi:hypothetical protein RPATATE_1284 [Rickettsia parkeri str. Tate's Hell]|uniref:Uncharacterized protein n=1 Tax=Rickettsia parkeri str. Tate's Hell TaxID=1359189 RepID=A0ABR5DP64_RICPA|nr:hypothetical protein RPAAT24_1240 [Rickettsia parkeri str. AT\